MHSMAGNKFKKVITVLFLLLIMIPAGLVQAQTVESSVPYARRQGPDRSGFTLLLTMGVGFQKSGSGDVRTGLGGLNLGIGGFVSPDLAVMFRISGTSVSSKRSYYGGSSYFVSGVAGVSVQFWPSDSFNFEGGVGSGISGTSGSYSSGRRGYGFILGGAYSFYHKNKGSLQIGIEYAPAIYEYGTIHNVSIAFGWQLL
jgi:hypothetical protein